MDEEEEQVLESLETLDDHVFLVGRRHLGEGNAHSSRQNEDGEHVALGERSDDIVGDYAQDMVIV